MRKATRYRQSGWSVIQPGWKLVRSVATWAILLGTFWLSGGIVRNAFAFLLRSLQLTTQFSRSYFNNTQLRSNRNPLEGYYRRFSWTSYTKPTESQNGGFFSNRISKSWANINRTERTEVQRLAGIAMKWISSWDALRMKTARVKIGLYWVCPNSLYLMWLGRFTLSDEAFSCLVELGAVGGLLLNLIKVYVRV
jgi:hypothetical protein